MNDVDITSLRELLEKWQVQTVEDLAPTASLIWVGERQGIQRCAMQLEKVIGKIEAVEAVRRFAMDPYNTSGDRPKDVSK